MSKGGDRVTRLLDAKTSQNASFFAAISSDFAFNPVPFAQVGLNVINPVGVVRVQFTATATIQIPADSGSIAVLMDIVRGTLPTDPLVYTGAFIEDNTSLAVTRAFTVTGSDYKVAPPPSNLLVYTAFLRCPDAVTLPGPGRRASTPPSMTTVDSAARTKSPLTRHSAQTGIFRLVFVFNSRSCNESNPKATATLSASKNDISPGAPEETIL
jgi:hypothetical protein